MSHSDSFQEELTVLAAHVRMLRDAERQRATRRSNVLRVVRRAGVAVAAALALMPVLASAIGPVPSGEVAAGDAITADDWNDNFAHVVDGISALETAAPTVPGATSPTRIVAGGIRHDNTTNADSYSLDSFQVGEGWVQSIVRDSVGVIRVNVANNTFADRPICECGYRPGAARPCGYDLQDSTADVLEFHMFGFSDAGPPPPEDRDFHFMCVGQAG